MNKNSSYSQKILATLDFHAVLERCAAHASTSLGKSRVEELEPSGSFDEVKRRLQATDEAVNVERLKGGAPFGGIRDIRPALHRARIGGMLNPAELLDIALTSQGGRRLQRFLESINEDYPVPLLVESTEPMTDHKALEDRIRQCIDENAHVVDSASPELARIRSELRGSESKARERLEQMVRTPSIQKMLQDNLVTIRNDRYVIPVKQEYRSHFGGMIHDQSASGATLFIEPEAVVQMNNRVRELKLKEEAEVEKILRMLSALVAEAADLLVVNVEILGELDFIFAKAGLARTMKATLPLLNDRGFIKLKRGRHPLIASENVVPLDVELGGKYSSIIVTGPNTGGKTVSLKTIGLLSLMAMSGMFVPAEEGSQLCVFDAIYADIGDEQSIEQNLSTFSSHMTNIIRILREMTPKSLVLLDELGAGTDPAEGSALAISILDYMHRMGCRIVATTHYTELKAYAYDRQGVINASMEFDVQTLRPTYRLLVGVPGRSNAFAIAERLGLSRSIIENARGQVGEEEQRVESMIATLEQNTIQAEAERATAQELRREVETLREKLNAERHRFEEQRDKLLEKAEREGREAVAKARREAEEVIAELRRLQREEAGGVKDHKLSELKKKLNDAAPELRSKQVSQLPKKKPETIGPGDEVLVTNLGQRGHVVDVVNAQEYTVQLGILKMKVNKADLELVKQAPQKKAEPPKATSSLKRTRDENAKMELDLRGANVEEAMIEVDRFLDESYLANFGQVYIIHGKGTGVLRAGIQEYLRKHKHVKSYRMGNYNEGGAGVTVAELK
ncbi:recombination and DNA strand exchange inhibitor protein [Paenibacillus mucilaginosus 3016]|uniref:Endonuclease MutS2 n=1 Tax=Paenibacillus mucilaginosus 3016 TaxID=1116391 RepID=H6NGH4_9BACL|nr:endonuclease MutS2 [Paenibacillus mucilaginosus]AFC33056.1 recombination and DNA strand exchange inhibitor protein [Paenibacillus mucilaginosus 3016]WFA21495.1 endonuclease MutS2 [Paenibacillus mucilaginosus]